MKNQEVQPIGRLELADHRFSDPSSVCRHRYSFTPATLSKTCRLHTRYPEANPCISAGNGRGGGRPLRYMEGKLRHNPNQHRTTPKVD